MKKGGEKCGETVEPLEVDTYARLPVGLVLPHQVSIHHSEQEHTPTRTYST